MAYRGVDLESRTPPGWGRNGRGTAGREAGPNDDMGVYVGPYHGGRADPIWVDDTVMACCNHAFDLAIAHRAPEVRLEHLLNAMTLNDATAQALAARGIGVAQLRRESGTILASEVPAGPSSGRLRPKRSEALEEALRLAADRAYPRRTPATVDDILHVLFDMQRDLPGLQLLRRHSPPRPGQPSIPGQDYFAQPQSLKQNPQPTRYPRVSEPAAAAVDALQNNRLDALDRAVRDLGLDLANDRKLLQSIVGDLQRQSATQAEDTSRFRGSLGDRLDALEQAVLRVGEPDQVPLGQLVERLAGLEHTLDQRMAEIGRGWMMTAERLQGAEHGAGRLEQRLGVLERTLSLLLDQTAGPWRS